MLVLSRKPGETIHVGEDVTITVCQTRTGAVRLGIDAPQDKPIVRGELRVGLADGGDGGDGEGRIAS